MKVADCFNRRELIERIRPTILSPGSFLDYPVSIEQQVSGVVAQ